ncbi:MAG: ferritin-like domain-containing protein [Nitrospinaceae bacterium]
MSQAPIQLGSEEHKTLFCREFIDTHKVFDPQDLPWPELTPTVIDKLTRFPIWDHAIHTERQVFNKLKAYAEEIEDPLLRKAMALQAYEEGRHADILKYFLDRYAIPFNPKPDNPLPPNLEWGFMQTGAGECIDSFFAFGFLQISKSTQDYPQELIAAMEPVVQEEARHILFIQNWLYYQRYSRPGWTHPIHFLLTQYAFLVSGWRRLMDLKTMGGAAFTAQATKYEKNSSFSPKSFIELCLKENKRRLSPYDPRLARPKLIPRVMGLVRNFL